MSARFVPQPNCYRFGRTISTKHPGANILESVRGIRFGQVRSAVVHARVRNPSIMPPPGGFRGPVKRSITIAGHQTSISLEPLFWTALADVARTHGLPLSALVGEIDALRIVAPDPPNLASALRVWLFDTFRDKDENCSH